MNNPLDLDAIKARAENAATASGRSGMEYIVDCVKSAADVPALVAEVERLRAEVEDLRHELTDARENY